VRFVRPLLAAAGSAVLLAAPAMHADDRAEEIRNFLDSWRKSWEMTAEKQSIDHLRAYYDDDFRRGKGKKASDREKVLAGVLGRAKEVKKIRVTLSDLQMRPVRGAPERARVRFHQLYETDAEFSEGEKRLVLVNRNGAWKILASRYRDTVSGPIALAPFPLKVKKACAKGAKRTRVTVHPMALFGRQVRGVLLECHRRAPEAAGEAEHPSNDETQFVHYIVFVLREAQSGWAVVHRANEGYEQGIFLQTLRHGDQELLLQQEHNGGGGADRITILGASSSGKRLRVLFRASPEEETGPHKICCAQSAGSVLRIRFFQQKDLRRLEPRLRSRALKVELHLVYESEPCEEVTQQSESVPACGPPAAKPTP
jgi:hypothetical protein